MPATKRLVLELPEEVVDAIDARVSSGEFADAREVVAVAVSRLPLAGSSPPQGFTPAAWDGFAASCRETLARLDAGIEPTLSPEEVRAQLARRRSERAAAAR